MLQDPGWKGNGAIYVDRLVGTEGSAKIRAPSGPASVAGRADQRGWPKAMFLHLQMPIPSSSSTCRRFQVCRTPCQKPHAFDEGKASDLPPPPRFQWPGPQRVSLVDLNHLPSSLRDLLRPPSIAPFRSVSCSSPRQARP